MLYSLLVGEVSYSIYRHYKIWCTDGSFESPDSFKESYKTAYGYRIDRNTVASLRMSHKMMFTNANQYCSNLGGYIPSKGEMETLYLLRGTMIHDLNKAGVLGSCNYYTGYPISDSWTSSTDPRTQGTYIVGTMGSVGTISQSDLKIYCSHVIPFFKVKV